MPCDTFVISLPGNHKVRTIFGKNSDRPGDEIQEVVAAKGSKKNEEKRLKVRLIVRIVNFLTFLVISCVFTVCVLLRVRKCLFFLQCTYIDIDEVKETYDVVLSKPSWMWGAEMGANEHGVCIGNEAVWNKAQTASDLQPALLGMDLVR